MTEPERYEWLGKLKLKPLDLDGLSIDEGHQGAVEVVVPDEPGGHPLGGQHDIYRWIEPQDIPKVIAWLRARHKDNEEGKA